MTTKQKLVFVGVLCAFPFVASAAWWNPVSWFGGWFGLFDSYASQKNAEQIAVETVPIKDDSPSSSFFSKAKPKNPEQQHEAAPATSTKPVVPSPSPTAPKPSPVFGIEIPPAPPNTNTPVAVQPQVPIHMFDDIRLARKTSGYATSSNILYIGALSTTTRLTIKQVTTGGISFNTNASACKSTPCALTNVVSIASSVKEGTYPVQVTISAGTTTVLGSFSVIVLPPEPLDVAMTISGPISVKKYANGSVSGSNIVSIQVIRGTPESLTITQSELPDGVTGRASLGTCTPPCKLTNMLSISSDAVSGQYSMVIRANGTTISRSASYSLNIGYSNAFGMHFDGESRTYTQNQNPTASIIMDYPFDLLLDGGTPETVTLSSKSYNASTSVTFSQTSCTLPCKGLSARIQLLPGMNTGTYNIPLTATVKRNEDDGRGGTRVVTYTEIKNISVKIVSLTNP